jgi:sucrose phosphorylase
VDEQDLMRAAKMQYTSATALAGIINQALDEGKTPSEIEFGAFSQHKAAVVEWLESNRKYLGQMDLNIKSPLVWEHYDNTLKALSGYGAKIVRLDAFAYAPKEPGEKNFLNDPGTWELLEKVQKLADKYGVMLLPEIHASYEEKIYELLSEKGYMTYDFFLPGLIIDALEEKNAEMLVKWAKELQDKKIRVVNMLGCHDGIPLLDLKGMIPEERIQKLIDTIVARGGFVKNLHGQKNVYYQVNATYYSALGENDAKMLLARAIQIFMPGKPQVWYLDLFAGKNDYEAMKRAGAGGHKEINRTNLSGGEVKEKLGEEVVKKQIALLKFRNTFPAFGFESELSMEQNGVSIKMCWKKDGYEAVLLANMDTFEFEIYGCTPDGEKVLTLSKKFPAS